MRPKQKTRDEQEKDEELQTLRKDVPDSRFQTDQQVNPTAAAEDVKPVASDYQKIKATGTGSRVKQDVAAKVITMANAGGDANNEGSSGAAVLGYDGGNASNVAGSAAYTPKVGQSRSDSRYGKKLDATAKKLNFVPSEQVEVAYDESKPLSKSPEAVQGYNGTFRNTNARAQKVSGAVPGSLLFQRSVDEIARDQMYYVSGQMIGTTAQLEDTPTITQGVGENGEIVDAPYTIVKGNYIPRKLHIQFDANRRLEKFYFDVDDISVESDDPTVINSSSTNRIIDANAAEMNRQRMDDKAGDEKADLWTPLARAVKEPSRTVSFLRDMEAITGAAVWMAYKKTALANSYQLNRAAKDGQQVVTPMKEAVLGCIKSYYTQGEWENERLFDMDNYVNGSSDLYLAINDTVRKYKTKADLLLQPRSFKAALQIADNNMNPLRLKATFAQAVNNREVFSTIDRGYDPLLPVCISDKEVLAYPYDFNDLYAFKSIDNDGNPVFENAPYRYAYSDLRNWYLVNVENPLLKGIADYLRDNASNFMKAQAEFNDNKISLTGREIVIPIVSSTTSYSLWDLLVLSATPYITKARVNSMRDVLYYESNIEYPFSQLISIRECNPMNAVNYNHSDYNEPIQCGVMMPSVAITWVFPELFIPFDEKSSGDAYSMILPWYFNEQEFSFSRGQTMSRKRDTHAMTMFSLRDETRFSFLDLLYSMEERDIRLSLDKMTIPPLPVASTAESGVYKYDQNSDGIPFTTYAASDLTYRSILSTPREEGFFAVVPGSYAHPAPTDGLASADDPTYGQSSYRVKCWAGTRLVLDKEVNDGYDIAIDRAKAYVQTWYCTDALLHKSESGPADNGFVFSLADLFDGATVKNNKGRFCPFTDGVSSGVSGGEGKLTDYGVYGLVSTQKAMWTRIQKLPFAISPFDASSMYRKVGEDAVKVDPFDMLYSFGLCGFRASDYREDVYNRENQIVDQGFAYLQDPWVRDNPVFKESIDVTESYNAGKLTEVIA